MPGHDMIVVGASAGGVEALSTIARSLPADLPAAVFVVQHLAPDSPSVLPRILGRLGALPAVHAQNGDQIEQGRIYVAPPDHHLLVKRGTLRVVRGPRENRSRPAVDPLFRSAARAYGPRVVGVILSGSLDDGTAGLLAIKERRGVAIAQDPREALFPSMPRSAIAHVPVDHVLPLDAIAPQLVRLVYEPVNEEGMTPVPDGMDDELEVAELDMAALEEMEVPGALSVFTCPECNGPLWEIRDGAFVRYRCHVGHALTADHLIGAQTQAIEETLWSALRGLESHATLNRRLAGLSRERGTTASAVRFEAQAHEAHRHARLVRDLLRAGTSATPDLDHGIDDVATTPLTES